MARAREGGECRAPVIFFPTDFSLPKNFLPLALTASAAAAAALGARALRLPRGILTVQRDLCLRLSLHILHTGTALRRRQTKEGGGGGGARRVVL